jgi:uncharacterized protein
MTWMIAIGCFLAGAVIGAVLFKLLKSDEVRVHMLEEKMQQLGDEYARYKKDVHNHFSDTAQLVTKLTQSYQEVYQHLAQGAQELCPEHIAKQVTTAAPALLAELPARNENPRQATPILSPPLDYASPAQLEGNTRKLPSSETPSLGFSTQ